MYAPLKDSSDLQTMKIITTCMEMSHYEQANNLSIPNKISQVTVSFINICHKGAFFYLFPYLDVDFFQVVCLPNIYIRELNILFLSSIHIIISHTYNR